MARVYATPDLMTNGRAAWNIVTSMNDGEAFNMGRVARRACRAMIVADEFPEAHRGTGILGRRRADWPQSGLFAHPAGARSCRRILPFARTVHRAAVLARSSVLIGAGGRGRSLPRAGPSWCSSLTTRWTCQDDYASFAAGSRDRS